MIGMLRGQVFSLSARALVLDVHGIGYEVRPSSALLAEAVVGQELQVVIYTDVKQDDIRLYGFIDQLEREVFKLLMMVKGIGAKSASEVISKVDKRELLRIIAAGDSAALQRVKGIGKKTSERIIVELKDTVGDYIIDAPSDAHAIAHEPLREAEEALLSLGFPKKDAERLLAMVKEQEPTLASASSGDIVRMALRRV